jgi:hypothetical protein
MVELRHRFIEITCPDTGKPIMVARSTRDDPVGALYVSGQISHHQREAAAAYVSDVEAMAGQVRAPSNGPSDLTWRQRRSGGHQLARPHDRLQRAHARLGPDRAKLVKAILIDGATAGHRVRELHQALNDLAVVYGYSTRTRH